MSLIRFYRHAESMKNKNPHLVGGRSISSLLTPTTGRRQADELGPAMRRENRDFFAAFASPAIRARQTGRRALQSAGVGLPLLIHEGLLEISQGLWEGRDRREPLLLPDGTVEVYTHPHRRGLDGRVTGGQSVAEVGQRMEQALLDLAKPFEDQDAEIAVFGHDFALRCLRVRLENEPDHIRSRVDYCSETTIAVRGGQLAIMQFGVPMIDQALASSTS
jgi:broad specificity phosphatase PhoE